MKAQGQRLYHLGTKPIARSSLARLNEQQPYTFYEALFARLYARCQNLAPGHGFRFKNKLYLLDASLIDLSLSIFPWAHYALGKAAMKLHVGLDHAGHLPAFVTVTDGKTSDIEVGRTLNFVPPSRWGGVGGEAATGPFTHSANYTRCVVSMPQARRTGEADV